MEQRTTKDKIIDFVKNSPEEVNTVLDAFIAGMLAQKNLTDCHRGTDKDSLSIVKTDTGKKQGA